MLYSNKTNNEANNEANSEANGEANSEMSSMNLIFITSIAFITLRDDSK